ncbi:MAG: PAS domain-containing protein, partial [Microvirga sp.]
MKLEDEARTSGTGARIRRPPAFGYEHGPLEDDELYRRAVELSRQVPWTSDPEGRVLAFGSGWSKLTGGVPGVRYEDLLGVGLATYMHPDDQVALNEIRRRSLAGGESYQSEFRLKVPGIGYRWFRSRAGSERDATGAVVRWYGTIEDIHEHKQAELSYRSDARVLEMVAAGRPVPEVLDALCIIAEERIPDARCSILLLDREHGTLRHGAAPNLPKSYTAALDGIAIGPTIGSCGTAAHERKDVIVTDIASDPLWDRWKDLALSHGLAACWSKPVLSRSGEVLGTFAFYYGEPRTPTPAEMARIDTVLHLAALAIERQRGDAALRESEEHYRHSVELNPQIPWSADAQGIVVEGSPRWEVLTGTPVSEALGSGWMRVVHPDDSEPVTRRWMQSLRTGEAFDVDYRVRRWDGDYHWVRARAAPRRGEDGAILRWYGTLEDIHDRKTAKERLQWAAHHDDMTNLPNRRLFGERLRVALDRAEQSRGLVGLLIMDLDDFKQINDRFG